MDRFWYVFAAFAVVWAVLFGYIWMLLARQQQLRKEFELLKQDLKAKK